MWHGTCGRCAHWAVRVARDLHGLKIHVACVQHQQPTQQGLAALGQPLDGLGGLHGAYDAHQGRKHAHGGTQRFFKLTVGGKQTGIAGRVAHARVVHRQLTVKPNRRTRHQGLAMPVAGGIDQVARGKVVAAVQHHVGTGQQLVQQRRVGPRGQGCDLNLWVDGQNSLGGRLHFGLPHPVLRVGNLALQVGGIHHVMVDQGDAPNPGTTLVGFELKLEPNQKQAVQVLLIPGSVGEKNVEFEKALGSW